MKRVLCISWNPKLAEERRQIFESSGCSVLSVVGPAAEQYAASEDADLLVIGYSVPRDEKRRFMRLFRRHSEAPILSLLYPGQSPLPEATMGAVGTDHSHLARVVRDIVGCGR